MVEIRFQNFIPKDDEFKPFVHPPVSIDLEQIKRAYELRVSEAKMAPFSKNPTNPNWDLKRDFANRQVKLNVRTNRAIAQLRGVALVEEEEPEEVLDSAPEPTEVVEHLIELSSDEEDELFKEHVSKIQISRDDIGLHDE